MSELKLSENLRIYAKNRDIHLKSGDLYNYLRQAEKLEQQLKAHKATIAEQSERVTVLEFSNAALRAEIDVYNDQLAELQEERKFLNELTLGHEFKGIKFVVDDSLQENEFIFKVPNIYTPPDSKPELLDHNTSEDCWCEPEEVSDGVFVHKDRH